MKTASITRTALASVVVLGLCGYAFAGQTIYVDDNAVGSNDGSSWANAYNYLQDALADANSAAKSVEIWVAEGVYKPDHGKNQHLEDQYASFQLQNLVTIKGGYGGIGEPDPNARDISLYETILSGEISDDEDSCHVVTGSWTDRTAVLDGFTITEGEAYNVSNNNDLGGGMYSYAGSPTIRNCTFTNNWALNYGGGMCNDGNSCPLLINCIFVQNSATDGGGMDNEYSHPILINCVFVGNWVDEYNADSFSGGAIYNFYSNPTLINCTITANVAVEWGICGGIYNSTSSRPTLTNCILSENSDTNGKTESSQIYGGTLLINYCCVQGWTGDLGGTGNTGSDPLFVDADGIDNIIGTEDDNLRLLAGSPCIDAGDNSVVTVTTDLDGNPRIVNGMVDMGAYEFHGLFLSSGSITVPEGQTAAFTVALAVDPLGTVEASVTVASGDPDITIESGALLTFDSSNYAIPQSVTLAAAEDPDYLNGVAQISISATEFLYAWVTVTEMDNEIVPAVLYVDSGVDDSGTNQGRSWSDAFTDLQQALGIAQKYSQIKEIRVAQGIYKPDQGVGITPGDREATFQLKNDLILKGGYAGYGQPDPDAREINLYETILSGDLDSNDVDVNNPADLLDEPTRAENSYHVLTGSGTDSTAVLDGFTVVAGNANGYSEAGYDNGGGMYNYFGSPTVMNCIFKCNSANDDGGGMLNWQGSSPTVTNCTFSGNYTNRGGGMSNEWFSNPTLARCTFRANSVKHGGGGVCSSYDSSPTLSDCIFIGNSAGTAGAASNGSDCKPIFTRCVFIDNLADSLGGAMCNNGRSNTIITNCLFSGNSAGWAGGALYNPSSNSVLTNCTFTNNSAAQYGGATYIYNYSIQALSNCIFWNNTSIHGSQVALHDGSAVSISYCDVEGGWLGIYNSSSTIDWGEGNIDVDPCFVDPGYRDTNGTLEDANDDFWVDGDYHLLLGSRCIDAGDPNYVPEPGETDLDGNPRFIGGRVDMGAYEFQGIQTLYVDADAPIGGDGKSWATAFKHLQDALFNSISPTEIRVAQGIYKPHLNSYSAQPPSRSDTFQLKNGVTIKGGYAGLGNPDPNARDFELYETILSGDLNGDDVEVDPVDLLDEPTRSENCYNVVTGTGCSRSAILEGFTITGGNANGTLLSDMSGGGIYDGDLTVISCKIVGNSAAGGGGVSCHSGSTLSDCTISGNAALSAGGGLSGVISVVNCTISDNLATHFSAQGGGISCRDTELVSGCTFINNSSRFGGGLATSYDLPTVVNCRFIGNSAHEGGGVYSGGFSPELIGCVFIGNTADDGGGLYAYEGFPRIVNCTFAHNYSPLGGGMNTPEGGPVVVNCVFWGNRAGEEIRDELAQLGVSGGGVTVAYSCVQGWTGTLGGTGNIGDNPLFVDPNGADGVAGTEDDNLRLLLGSPCIDTGDPNYIAEPNETDLDGNPRVIGGRIDMGAYEFCGPVYVDDDGPNDPGPVDPQISDPLENGTDAHPFDTVQEAVNVAIEGYAVLVRQGSYFELGTSKCIDFLGKNITLTSAEPTDWDVVDNTVVRGYVQFSGPEGPNCKFTGFRISSLEGAIYGNHTHATINHCNISGNGPCGATVIKDCDGIISNCLITDNTTFFRCGVFPVIFGCNGLIKNCTIANNESGLFVDTATIENCIIYNNHGSQLAVTNGNKVDISYSNVQNGLAGIVIVGDGHVDWGPGNIDTDPCFIRLGYWIMDEMTLIEGDYHLGSEGWRWNTDSKSWTYDYITSRCIDAGNPGSPLRGELMSVPRDPDNVWGINLRINMGAFGGTSQASMPPHDWALLADLNNDGTANFADFAYQAQDWLKTAPEQPGDLNRDGVLNTRDLALLAEEWLKMTVWIE